MLFKSFGFDKIDKKECLTNLNKTIFPDAKLLVIFVPYEFLDEDFDKCIRQYYSGDYIAISAIGVMFNENLFYDGISGFGYYGENYNIFLQEDITENIEKTADNLKNYYLNNTENVNLIFANVSPVSINKVLDNLHNFTEEGNLWGGIASSADKEFRTRIIYNGKFIEDGFVVLTLKNLKIYSNISLGFIPVGLPYKITKAKDNKVYEIEGMKIDYFLEKLLQGTGINLENLDPLTTAYTLWNFPFLILNKEYGYVSVNRTAYKYDKEENALIFYGNIEEGSEIRIAIADSEDILNSFERIIKHFQDEIKNKKIYIMLNFSCLARIYLLKKEGKEQEEQKILKKYFPTIDIVGFLTSGEIGHDRFGKAGMLYNETSLIVAIGE